MIGMYFIPALVIIAIATIIIDAVTGKSIYLNYVVKQDLRGRLQGPSLHTPLGWMSSAGTCCCACFGASGTPVYGNRGHHHFMYSSAVSWELFAGYYGKTADNHRENYGHSSGIPSMLLAIAIVAALGTSITNVLVLLLPSP